MFPELHAFRQSHAKKLIFGHLNINSIRNKFFEISEILHNNYCDIFGLTETKLDESFSNAQFHVNDFSLYRNDRNEHGGGIAFYIKSNIPHRIRKDIAVHENEVEHLVLEICINKEKCFFILLYKPPSVECNALSLLLETMCSKCLLECKTVYILGDFNVNMLQEQHSLSDTFNVLSLKNVIKGPTCFKNVVSPSLLDGIVTNTPRRLGGTVNICLGISDFHNFVGAATKLGLPNFAPRVITYRSMKHFKDDEYVNDMQSAPFHVGEIFDDINDKMWYFDKLFNEITEFHAPTKTKTIKQHQLPYMNGDLRRAINVKAMLRKKFYKSRCNHSWTKFKNQRNLVNRLKRQAKKTYFDKHCNNVYESNDKPFWKTVKPFFSNGGCSTANISLQEQNQLISEPNEVCNVLNNHFIDAADNLREPYGLDSMNIDQLNDYYASHTSVSFIKSNIRDISQKNFSFEKVDSYTVLKKCMSLKPGKSPGYDRLSSKFFKLAGHTICHDLAHIVNYCFEVSVFPDSLKHAIVTPVFKKDDPLKKSNYRPVSVLTCLSKIFESILCDQMVCYFDPLMSKSLSAYRKAYSCEDVLLSCIEEWKEALDKNMYVGVIAMDLSKAFDSLPHNLLLTKLSAYGMSNNAVSLIKTYLLSRKQCVKLGNHFSHWQMMKRGVPQGSLTGPLLFNIFLNDFILDISRFCKVFNYADDNSLSLKHNDVNMMKKDIEVASMKAISWFSVNHMQANPEKFQAMVLHRSMKTCSITFNIANAVIVPNDCIKLLGVLIDDNLSFENHISSLCKKAAKQVNALSRISKNLNFSSKMKIVNAFIFSNFNYCSLTYHFCSKKNEYKLEKMQERALRVAFNDYVSQYHDLLKKANLQTLYNKRCKKVLEHVYKVIHDLSPLFPNDFYVVKNISYGLRYGKPLNLPNYNYVRFGKYSLKYQASKYWNALNVKFDEIDNLNQFKNALESCELLSM